MTDTTTRPVSPAGQRQALLAKWRGALLPDRGAAAGAPRVDVAGPTGSQDAGAPLSFSQERLWLLDQVLPDDSQYNTVPIAARLRGDLDLDRLRRALTRVAQRHEVMRTRVQLVDGEPRQFVDDDVDVRVEVKDLRLRSDPEQAAMEQVRADRRHRFVLEAGSLFLTLVYRIADDEVMLLHLMHHAVSDGWSDDILLRDLARAYFSDAPLPVLPVQYSDYARRQRAQLDGTALTKLLDHWSSELEGAPLVLDLPVDHPRPVPQRYHATTLPVRIPVENSQAVRALAREAGSTPYVVLLSAVAAWLSRYGGQEDLLIGSPVAGRSSATDLEELIGCFVNTVVMRVETGGNPTSRELVARVRSRVLSAVDHQDLPFDRLVQHLRPPRDATRHPIFQVMFALQDSPSQALELDGFRMTPVEIDNAVAKFDVTVDLHEFEGEFVGRVQFDSDLFDPETCALLLEHLYVAVAEFVAHPDRPIGDHALSDRAMLDHEVDRWNATEVERRPACLHDQILAVATERPDAIAVSAPAGQFSYRALTSTAAALAVELRRLGARPEVPVALLVERDLWAPVGILGALMAGAAYVPLDPSLPVERIGQVLDDCGAQIVIAQNSLRDQIRRLDVQVVAVDALRPSAPFEELAHEPAKPDNIAYVIYTSGSTGTPKGVMISHAAATNMLASTQAHVAARADDVVLQYASVGFDVSVLEIFLALVSGARLVLVDREVALDAAALERLARREQITVMDVPPAMLERLDPTSFGSLRIQFIGCEAFSATLVGRWQSERHRLINGYGPTEATVMMTLEELDRRYDQAPPIGTPMDNHAAYLLDQGGRHQPPLVPGELHIAGTGLARGYLGRPGLTAERFGPDPFGRRGTRMYRTGDVCTRRPDGRLVFVGRSDNQVKLRGLRIEVGEIENHLAQHDAVGQVVVCLLDDEAGKRLAAYVVARAERVAPREVLTWLRDRLPAYMVPQELVWVDAFPLLSSGKVNRAALPAAALASAGAEDYASSGGTRAVQPVPARRDAEEHVRWAMRDVLGVDAEPDDTFFDLGGNSLQLAELQVRLCRYNGFEISLRDLYQAPTVAQLAALIREVSTGPTYDMGAGQPAAGGPQPAPERSSWSPSARASSAKDETTLTRAQREVWSRLARGVPVAIKPLAFRLPGPVDVSALAGALRAIATRHSILQFTLVEATDGARMRRTRDPGEAVLLEVVTDRDPRPDGDVVAACAEVPFDVTAGPLLAVRVYERDAGELLVCITGHPLVFDGRSRVILARELLALLSKRGRFLPILPMQYADLARGEADEPSVVLKSAGGPTTTFNELRVATPGVAEREVVSPPEVAALLDQARIRLGHGPAGVLLGAFGVAVGLCIPQLPTGAVIGIPVAGRTRPGSPALIGRFVRTLPAQVAFESSEPLREVLARAESAMADVVAAQVGGVVSLSGVEEWDDGPGARVTFDLLEPDLLVGGAELGVTPVHSSRPQTDFDLTLSCTLGQGQLRSRLVWRTGVVDEDQVDALLRVFGRVLRWLEGDDLHLVVGELAG